MNKFLNVIFPKIFATFVITILGHAAFTSVPLWAGICLVIPGFSLFLALFLNDNVQFVEHHPIPSYKRESLSNLHCKNTGIRRRVFGF